MSGFGESNLVLETFFEVISNTLGMNNKVFLTFRFSPFSPIHINHTQLQRGFAHMIVDSRWKAANLCHRAIDKDRQE